MIDKHWCMCINLQSVFRDCFSTCSICGGQDAYGQSVNRPEDKQKTVVLPVWNPPAIPESLMEKSAIEILLDKVTKENSDLKKQLTDARRYGNLEANKASRLERQLELLAKEVCHIVPPSYMQHYTEWFKTLECDKIKEWVKWSLAEVKEEYKL